MQFSFQALYDMVLRAMSTPPKLHVFHFANASSSIEFLKDSVFGKAQHETHETVFTEIREHSLYEPITTPPPYNPKDLVILIVGDTIPFRCNFNFLPPSPKNEGDPEIPQMPVIVLDCGTQRCYPRKPDCSIISIGVKHYNYRFWNIQILEEVMSIPEL